MDPGAEDARRLAVRLTEYLTQGGRGGVVEPVEDEDGAAAVELRIPGGPLAPDGVRGDRRLRWRVDPGHIDSQFRDLCRRIELALAAPAGEASRSPSPVSHGWCEWE